MNLFVLTGQSTPEDIKQELRDKENKQKKSGVFDHPKVLSKSTLYRRNNHDPEKSVGRAFDRAVQSVKTETRSKRGLFCDIDRDYVHYLLLKQQKMCALSNVPLSGAQGDLHMLSLDRINSNYSYTEDNVQLVTAQVNVAKSDYKQIEFIEMCLRVAINAINRGWITPDFKVTEDEYLLLRQFA